MSLNTNTVSIVIISKYCSICDKSALDVTETPANFAALLD